MSFHDLTLCHYSAEKLSKKDLYDAKQAYYSQASYSKDVNPRHFDIKPKGLWLSVNSEDNNWRTWCEKENFNAERFVYQHAVTLTKNANIWNKSAIHSIKGKKL